MCGIFGIVRHDGREIPTDTIDRMAGILRHRGPDHTGIHRESHCALGNNRLAIIDLDSGNQPIHNEDGRLLIVFNGEIYNYRALRGVLENAGHRFATRSDTEVILHAFEEYGPGCIDHLNGMFAFAIWNVETRELFVARDRLGIKPIYMIQTDGMFAFASEPKALIDLLPHAPRPDWTAISRYFSFGYFPLEDCAFEGIEKFPAGHFGWIRNGQLDRTRFWAPSYGGGEDIPFEEACRRTEALAEEVVRKELESDVPVGVFLSGGLDSSLVALYTQKLSGDKISSFSLGFEESSHDETAEAQLIADHLGLRHHPYRMNRDMLRDSLFQVADCMDEPFGDSTVLPLHILSRLTRNEVKVTLTGWGGDELFAGYPTYRAHRLAETYRRLPSFLTRSLIPALVDRLPVSDKYMSFEFKAKRFIRGMELSPEEQHFMWMGYYGDDGKRRLFSAGILKEIHSGTLDPLIGAFETLPESDLVDRVMHLDAMTFMEGNGLFQADRMSMAASLEARVPLLNNDMVDFVSALPISIKMRGGTLKAVLKHVLGPQLPPSILKLRKKGFGPPSAIWLREVFGDVLDQVFEKNRVDELGIFNHGEIQTLIEEHRLRRADHGRILWLILSFQLWFNRFILNESSIGPRPESLG